MQTASATLAEIHRADAGRAATEHAFLKRPAALARSAGDKAPEWMQIFPAGPRIDLADGRKFKLGDPQALAEQVNAAAQPILVDYDHLSAFDPDEGGETRAAGWIQKLEIRDGEVWARVEWTITAAEAITAGEWKFISPEFLVDEETREIVGLIAAALTNRPAMTMSALARAGSSTPKDQPMSKAIARALGLKDDATEAEILAAIKTRDDDHKRELAAEKTRAGRPSVDDFMPRSDYDAVLARAEKAEGTLKEAGEKAFRDRVETEIAAAVRNGRITPASKDHYIALCADQAQLDKVLAAVGASPVVTGGSGIAGKPEDEYEADEPKVIARKARAYQKEQAAAGNPIQIDEAVEAVQKGVAK